MAYWLVKTEPSTWSVEDFERAPDRTTCWDGVRNYQARNMLRDQMKVGDEVLVYHSSCEVPAVVGIARVAREGYPDATALDPAGDHHDPKATPDNPIWYMVDLQLVRRLARPIPLEELKRVPALSGLALVKTGNRLSVMPVTEGEWRAVLSLEG